MRTLSIFIGAPVYRSDDHKAVSQFLSDPGEKVILGGTAVSLFERETGLSAEVDLSSGSDGVPPYGRIGGIMAAEGTVTLDRLNDIFLADYRYRNAASVLKEKISDCEMINIYFGHACNAVNGIDKEAVVTELITNIKKTGKNPVIVDF